MDKRSRLGIIGGMGSVAAAYFFKRLVELTPARTDQEYIETFVHNNTMVPDRTAGVLYGQPSPLPELIRSVAILNDVGVDCIVLACMTSHHFIAELREHSSAEIIDGIAETAGRCREMGLSKVGIMASTGSIKLGLFQKRLENVGVESLILSDSDQETYFTEPVYADWGVKAGHITGRPRDLANQGARILIDSGADAIIAGCTELPLVFDAQELPVPLVDAVDVILERAIDRCLGRPALSRQAQAR